MQTAFPHLEWQCFQKWSHARQLLEVLPSLSSRDTWPTPEEWHSLALQEGLWQFLGHDLTFMFEQKLGQRAKRKESKQARAGRSYEYSILEKREIPTRANNLHDFLNAIIWFNFPRAKFHLHRRAYEVQQAWNQEHPQALRCPLADRLTCFDEGGVIFDLPAGVERSDVEALIQSRDDEGKRALVHSFADRFSLFGHGMMEVMLRGGANIYASCIIIEAGTDPLDARLAAYLADFDHTRPAHGGINVSWFRRA